MPAHCVISKHATTSSSSGPICAEAIVVEDHGHFQGTMGPILGTLWLVEPAGLEGIRGRLYDARAKRVWPALDA
jgi:hypothetical protein